MVDTKTKTSAAEIKERLLKIGHYSKPEQLDWLTDSYLEEIEKKATLLTPDMIKTGGEKLGPNLAVWSGNHWVHRNEGGVEMWYWKDTPADACGQTRDLKYRVNVGDSVAQQPQACAQGYPWFKFSLNYQ